MKKKVTVILLIILIIATLAYARTARFKIVTATGSVTASEGFLTKVIIRADRASTCTWNLYDFGSVTGGYTTTEKEIILTWVATTAEATAFYVQMDIPRVPFRDGLYAVISSTGEMAVYYEQ
jgi:high-affinity nickel permease